MCESRRHLLEQVLKREYAVYRSHLYHRKKVGHVGGTAPAASTRGGVSPAADRGQSWRGWMGILPKSVWKELNKGQRDAKQVRCLDAVLPATTIWRRHVAAGPTHSRRTTSGFRNGPCFFVLFYVIDDGKARLGVRAWVEVKASSHRYGRRNVIAATEFQRNRLWSNPFFVTISSLKTRSPMMITTFWGKLGCTMHELVFCKGPPAMLRRLLPSS